MASYFAAQLKDMFFVLVERVTGYGWTTQAQDGSSRLCLYSQALLPLWKMLVLLKYVN